MRLFFVALLIAIAGTSGLAQLQPAQQSPLPLSPAEKQIAFVNAQIAKNPGKSNLYTELAIGLIRRERETCDKTFFDQAQAALDKSLKLTPENLEAQKVEAVLLIGKHEFAEALVLAQSINKKIPDDVMSYGYIADADLALGDYADAEKQAQWMLDIRTHNVPGLLRGAELRQVFGDSEGALQFLNDAYQQTLPDQTEEIAWILTRMAEINLATGQLDTAEQLLQKALASFPNYYRSLEVQARVREAQHKYAEAADLLHLRNQHFPEPESIYAEAAALEQAGNAQKANELYASFERMAQAASNLADNDNRDLIAFYVSHKHNNSEALRIAHLAINQRHDIWTLDSNAMALYASGDNVEAEKQIEKAMAPGVRDGDIFYHAAQINAALKNQSAAVRYLQLSLEANPESEVSDNAREMLVKLAQPEYGATRK
jgi:predicted Zn-dependent protease